VKNTGFSAGADATISGSIDMANSPGSSVAVLLTSDATAPRSAADANVVDAVGYAACSAAWREGTACAPTHASGGSIERKARPTSDAASMGAGGADERSGNGQDSQQNGADFVVRSARDPQTSAVTEP
jgi:hypothetical protein